MVAVPARPLQCRFKKGYSPSCWLYKAAREEAKASEYVIVKDKIKTTTAGRNKSSAERCTTPEPNLSGLVSTKGEQAMAERSIVNENADS